MLLRLCKRSGIVQEFFLWGFFMLFVFFVLDPTRDVIHFGFLMYSILVGLSWGFNPEKSSKQLEFQTYNLFFSVF